MPPHWKCIRWKQRQYPVYEADQDEKGKMSIDLETKAQAFWHLAGEEAWTDEAFWKAIQPYLSVSEGYPLFGLDF